MTLLPQAASSLPAIRRSLGGRSSVHLLLSNSCRRSLFDICEEIVLGFKGMVTRCRALHLKDAGAISKALLDILVCPLSKQPLRFCQETQSLISDEIGISFPVSFFDWFLSEGGTRACIQRMWDPVAYALGFIDCDNISARCMLTIFTLFATKNEHSLLRMALHNSLDDHMPSSASIVADTMIEDYEFLKAFG